MNIAQITNKMTKLGAKVLFKTKNASPKILIGAGVAGVLGGVILACTETPKALDIVKEHKEKMETIKSVLEDTDKFGNDYNEADYRKDVFIQYSNTLWKLIRVYSPSALVLLASLSAILYSHGIMSKRNIELLAAYKTLEESFAKYREKVKERYGEAAEFVENFTVNTHDATRKDEKTAAEKECVHPDDISPYAKFFDEFNPNWEKDPSLNMFFLKAQEKFANQKLQSQGFLFLNDVYEALGFPKTSAGQLVGWYLGGDGDDYVDFGIFNGENEKKRDFVNGLERAILIDPNVDGVIYDLI